MKIHCKKKITLKKINKKKIGFILLFSLFFILFLYSLLHILKWKQEGQKLHQLSEEIGSIAQMTEKKPRLNGTGEFDESVFVNPASMKESDYYYYMKLPFLEVDFTSLQKKNPDTVAYIKVNGTSINYPVVYSGDNEYYLTHAFDKSKNLAGWLFMDYRNDIKELSDNTIIYGHGRLDSTVFGSMKKVLTENWQQEKDSYIIQISTPEFNYLYQIFSIYTIQEESYYITTDFTMEEEKQTWIDTMIKRNVAPIKTVVTTDDTFLTLSTCKNSSGDRIVIHAKMIMKDQR